MSETISASERIRRAKLAQLDRQESDYQFIAQSNIQKAKERGSEIIDPILMQEIDSLLPVFMKFVKDKNIDPYVYKEFDDDRPTGSAPSIQVAGVNTHTVAVKSAENIPSVNEPVSKEIIHSIRDKQTMLSKRANRMLGGKSDA